MSLTEKLKNSHQVTRFVAVGVVNTVLDFGILFGLKSVGVPVEFANICSTGVAFVFSFFANKKYTFKTTDTNVIREMLLFVIITLTGLWGLQTLIIALTHNPLTQLMGHTDVALLVAKLLATVASLTWNYLFYSRLVFKKN